MIDTKRTIIIAGHGEFAIAALAAVEMICGKQTGITAVALLPGEGLEELYQQYEKIVLSVKEGEILLLTDIDGGTPSNAATQLLLAYPYIQVFSGFNLPLLLEVVMDKWETLETVKMLINKRWGSYLTDINQKIKSKEGLDNEY